MVLVSLAVRAAAWAYLGTGTIESEGAEYAAIAENLRNGAGYVGIVSSGPQVIFHPLFPFLIAATSFVVNDYELAGRLVALLLGALLPLPVYGITSRLFSQRVGLIAAALTLLHPLSVHLSFMVYTEGPYATLLLAALYLVVRALDDNATRVWLLIGGAFGLCYLLRAEAVAAFAIAVVFAVVATKGDLAVRLRRALYAVVVFLLLAVPQVIFLYQSTGKIMLEAKSTILSSYTGRRIMAADTRPGVDYVSDGGQRDVPSSEPNIEAGYRWQDKWAVFGIDSDLKGTGFAMRPFADMARETQIKLNDVFPLLATGISSNLSGFFRRLSAGWLGAPLLPALALLGACCRPWRGSRGVTRLFMVSVTTAPVIATFLVLWGDARYYFIFVPLLCIWAANGLFEFGVWIRRSAAAVRWKAIAHPAVSQWLLPGLLGLATVVLPLKQVTTLSEFSDSAVPSRVDKELGLWIKSQHDTRVRIMDISLPLSYHANAQHHLFFPYSTGDLALRYLDAAKVDYVVLRRQRQFTQYYESWLTHGIPHPRAKLVQPPSVAGAENFVIYRWQRSD